MCHEPSRGQLSRPPRETVVGLDGCETGDNTTVTVDAHTSSMSLQLPEGMSEADRAWITDLVKLESAVQVNRTVMGVQGGTYGQGLNVAVDASRKGAHIVMSSSDQQNSGVKSTFDSGKKHGVDNMDRAQTHYSPNLFTPQSSNEHVPHSPSDIKPITGVAKSHFGDNATVTTHIQITNNDHHPSESTDEDNEQSILEPSGERIAGSIDRPRAQLEYERKSSGGSMTTDALSLLTVEAQETLVEKLGESGTDSTVRLLFDQLKDPHLPEEAKLPTLNRALALAGMEKLDPNLETLTKAANTQDSDFSARINSGSLSVMQGSKVSTMNHHVRNTSFQDSLHYPAFNEETDSNEHKTVLKKKKKNNNNKKDMTVDPDQKTLTGAQGGNFGDHNSITVIENYTFCSSHQNNARNNSHCLEENDRKNSNLNFNKNRKISYEDKLTTLTDNQIQCQLCANDKSEFDCNDERVKAIINLQRQHTISLNAVNRKDINQEFKNRNLPTKEITLNTTTITVADCTGINLHRISLSNFNLSYALFCNAILTQSDLKNTDLTGTNLENAIITDIKNLKAEVISKAYYVNLMFCDHNSDDIRRSLSDGEEIRKNRIIWMQSFFSGSDVDNKLSNMADEEFKELCLAMDDPFRLEI